MAKRNHRILITCEHAGNEVPAEYVPLFQSHQSLLQTHRGWDLGALPLAQRAAAFFSAPCHYSQTTRLLVDLNRSLGHVNLFSNITRPLPREDKNRILDRFYHPYRNQVQSVISNWLQRDGVVFHLSVHTFTPVLDGVRRNADVGLLYDPQRAREKSLCVEWLNQMRERCGFRIRRNYPYLGIADAFIPFLRKLFPPQRYIGIELEVNQCWTSEETETWAQSREHILESLSSVLPRIME